MYMKKSQLYERREIYTMVQGAGQAAPFVSCLLQPCKLDLILSILTAMVSEALQTFSHRAHPLRDTY
jgi:hypothetical protein